MSSRNRTATGSAQSRQRLWKRISRPGKSQRTASDSIPHCPYHFWTPSTTGPECSRTVPMSPHSRFLGSSNTQHRPQRRRPVHLEPPPPERAESQRARCSEDPGRGLPGAAKSGCTPPVPGSWTWSYFPRLLLQHRSRCYTGPRSGSPRSRASFHGHVSLGLAEDLASRQLQKDQKPRPLRSDAGGFAPDRLIVKVCPHLPIRGQGWSYPTVRSRGRRRHLALCVPGGTADRDRKEGGDTDGHPEEQIAAVIGFGELLPHNAD